jgi:hypothetical protein
MATAGDTLTNCRWVTGSCDVAAADATLTTSSSTLCHQSATNTGDDRSVTDTVGRWDDGNAERANSFAPTTDPYPTTHFIARTGNAAHWSSGDV